jgi:hypothetical protein
MRKDEITSQSRVLAMWILADERSSLLISIAATQSVFVVCTDEKLTEFVEIEPATRVASD